MPAQLISGKELAREIRDELKAEVAHLQTTHGVVPGLATVLIGDDPGSLSYVTGKIRGCEELGIRSFHLHLSATTGEDELLALIARLNVHPEIDGILVQLPLPKHIDEAKVLFAIDPNKDVDGFHPVNIGRMMIGECLFPPCTPAGIMEMLQRSGTPTQGAEAVVVGRSNIVGKPIAMMLMQKNPHADATVTLCHTRTRDLAAHTRRADILIVAAGRPKYITGDMIKPGATVIDVGPNRIGATPSGKAKLTGDVDFDAAVEIAGKITPVPGGVGPMTITMLLKNTVRAARLRIKE